MDNSTQNARENAREFFFAINTFNNIPTDFALDYLKTVNDELLAQQSAACGAELAAIYRKLDGQRERLLPTGEIKWKRLPKLFPLGSLAFLYFNDAWRFVRDSTNAGGVAAHWGDGFLSSGTTKGIEYGGSPAALYGGPTIPQAIQDRVVELAKVAFDRLDGVVGYITCDEVRPSTVGASSPYERQHGMEYGIASRDFRTIVRGYYWGNFLSAEHVRLLGGSLALSNAPVYSVERVGNGYYLQLSPDINNVTASALARLKEFLAPLLPTRESYQASINRWRASLGRI